MLQGSKNEQNDPDRWNLNSKESSSEFQKDLSALQNYVLINISYRLKGQTNKSHACLKFNAMLSDLIEPYPPSGFWFMKYHFSFQNHPPGKILGQMAPRKLDFLYLFKNARFWGKYHLCCFLIILNKFEVNYCFILYYSHFSNY